MATAPLVYSQDVSIDTDLLRRHVAALAADSMQGRRSGSEGEQLAARYVSLEFERIGLQPAGDSNTYLQSFYMNRARIYSTSYLQVGDDTLRYPVDFKIYKVPERATIWNAGLVFAGYGIHRPGMDSYESLDVTGRIAVVVAPEQRLADSIPQGVQAGDRELAAWAREVGAAGVILLSRSSDTERPWNRERYLAAEVFNPIDTSGFLWIKIADGERFLKRHFPQHSMATGFPESSSVAEVRVRSVMDIEPLNGLNVLGVIEGTDLIGEHIIVTAHLDHLGVTSDGGNDSIYNGALDNASGVASMLEVAHSLSRSRARPRRSIIFMAPSGEEQGLIGARYFIEHLTVQGDIVGNVNLDILGFALRGDQGWMTLLGAEYTDMGATFENAARSVGVKIAPNLLPSLFLRGDGYAFASSGIPSISPTSGMHGRDRMSGFNLFKAIYHQPSDELGNVPLDFEILRQQTQTVAAGVWELANRVQPPQWTRQLDSRSQLQLRDMLGFSRMWLGAHRGVVVILGAGLLLATYLAVNKGLGRR